MDVLTAQRLHLLTFPALRLPRFVLHAAPSPLMAHLALLVLLPLVLVAPPATLSKVASALLTPTARVPVHQSALFARLDSISIPTVLALLSAMRPLVALILQAATATSRPPPLLPPLLRPIAVLS